MRRIILASVIAFFTASQAAAQPELARQHPDSVRSLLATELSKTASSTTASSRKAALTRARTLAADYAHAWSDPFFVREVEWFASQSPTRQRDFVSADSLRRTGNDLLATKGPASASAAWRASLAIAEKLAYSPAVAPVLASIGAGYYRSGDLDSALMFLRKSDKLARASGDNRTLGNVTGLIASVEKEQGDATAALDLYKRAASVRALSGDTRGIAADENNIGTIYLERGALDQARAAFSRALSINRNEKRDRLVGLNLLNLGIIERNSGELSRAEDSLREALKYFRAAGGSADEPSVNHELGKVYVDRGEYDKAANAYRAALKGYQSTGATSDAVEAEIDLSAVEAAIGNPQAARSALSDAVRLAGTQSNAAQLLGIISAARADLAINFSSFGEAEDEYARAARLFGEANDSAHLARALEGQAFLAYRRSNNARALALVGNAKKLYLANNDRRSAALAALLQSSIQLAKGDSAASQKILASARATLAALGDKVGEAAALAAIGDMKREMHDFKGAVANYRAGLLALRGLRASDVEQRLHSGLGSALEAVGAADAAARELRAAIALNESEVATLGFDQLKSAYLSDKWDPYAKLALLEKSRRHTSEAFTVSELMRSRQLRDMLARGRIARNTPVSLQEQDLRRRVAVLARAIDSSSRGSSAVRESSIARAATFENRRRLESVQKEYSDLLLRLRENDPSYAAVAAPPSVKWKNVAAKLSGDEALIEYLLGDSTSIAFVITRDTIAAIDIRAPRERIADLVEFTRKTMQPSPSMRSRTLWKNSLGSLYSALISPIENAGLLRGKRNLIIVPHAELYFLSFASLMPAANIPKYLVESFNISYAPSAAIWLELAGRSRVRGGGVTALAPNADQLPGSKDEVRSLLRIYGRNASAHFGADATRASLEKDIAGSSVIHLATFGVLNKRNPLFSFVALAPSAGDDGRLEVHDVFGLPLNGQAVILSACHSAVGSGALADMPPGDDWLGLIQAFLSAGARSVVASLWPVDDRATSELMVEFHRGLASGQSTTIALANAQRKMIRASRANPSYWAGFTLNGRAE